MWPAKGVSSLQKTYDESYLKCSTAVYYESQGDEREAMASWQNALDQIHQNPAARRHPSYSPKSETERALLESLSELEVQCKERIDLLEALRVSRQEERSDANGSNPRPRPTERGWIGDGTIPAITYPELSKPSPPPPLPKRPSPVERASSSQAVIGNSSSPRSGFPFQPPVSTTTVKAPSLPAYGKPATKKKTERSPSPDKRTMRTTLRSGRSDRPSTPTSTKLTKSSGHKTAKGPGASKAATLAWNAVGTKDSHGSFPSVDSHNKSSRASEHRRSSDQGRKTSTTNQGKWDIHSRRLVELPAGTSAHRSTPESPVRISSDYTFNPPSSLALGAASSALSNLSVQEKYESGDAPAKHDRSAASKRGAAAAHAGSNSTTIVDGYHVSSGSAARDAMLRKRATATAVQPEPNSARKRTGRHHRSSGNVPEVESSSDGESTGPVSSSRRKEKGKEKEPPVTVDTNSDSEEGSVDEEEKKRKTEWEKRKNAILKNLPPGVDDSAAKSIFNEIVVQGDEVRWSDVAGLEVAKAALREAVVYPFLRPDLFMGLREPARGMLLFGPPGTGKTMLARAVATESRSTFFSISASSLTSKYLGESEKLVRALFGLAKVMAPSIIFVDEIDSLLSQRSGSGEHEATRRIKTEFLIQWSDLQRAAAGREGPASGLKDRGDPNRVLVLAATNLPWAIDEAARRRFVRRQYIPLPEDDTRATQLRTLLGQQKHSLTDDDIEDLVELTDGFSGSDITALAKDAAMGPLRSLGEALLHMTTDEIRPIELGDFRASLRTIRPSVGKEGLKEYEDWAVQFGERGG